jgi:hypothetical protein
MYTDYCLKFPDKQTALEAFSSTGLTYDLESPEVIYSKPVAIGSTTFFDEETQEEIITPLYDEPVAIATYTKAIIDQTVNAAIDEVGVIYNNDAVVEEDPETEEMIEITPATPKEGYHYNYRIVWGQGEEMPLAGVLTSYVVAPEQPVRQFF